MIHRSYPEIVCRIRKSPSLIEKIYTGAPNNTLIATAEADAALTKTLPTDVFLTPSSILLHTDKKEAIAHYDIHLYTPLSQTDSLLTKLSWFLKLCHTLATVHHHGWVCIGLRLDCLFVDSQALYILNAHPFQPINSHIPTHTSYQTLCPYVAPELIGKITSTIMDHRTDYYALGVILYELLTGHPFGYTPAYSPILDVSTLYPALVDIIAKLTSRLPQHRYQSTHGICADLTTCITALQHTGTITYFLPGMQDRIERFVFKETLYGRDQQLRMLLDTYTNKQNESLQIALLRGTPGVGKTAIARHFLNRLRRLSPNTFIATGKSDQIFETHYSVITQIIRHLFEAIRENTTHDWRTLLNQDLYPYGHLLSTLVPDIHSFFATQPEVPFVDPLKEKQRLHYLLGQFFSSLTRISGKPIVLFIDDLQWVDSSTLDFLSFLIRSECPLFLLASYRETNKGMVKQLETFFKECESIDTYVDLSIASLSEEEVLHFVSDLFPQAATEGQILLAQEAFKRTFGNPFFLRQLFLNAWDQHYIFIESDTKKMGWHLEKIKSIQLDGNIVDLVINRIGLLPKTTQDLLKIAAIMGQHFDLDDLSNIVDQDPVSVSLSLWIGIQEDFIADTTETTHGTYTPDTTKYRYSFLHDRIQSAFYSLVDPKTLPKQHYHIAQKLRQKTDIPVFAVANHLLAAAPCLLTVTEQTEAMQFCLEAGQLAKKASAFEAARTYFAFTATLCATLRDTLDISLQFTIQLALAESEYLCGDVENALANFERARHLCKDNLFQQAQLESMAIGLHTSTDNYDKALEIGVSILKKLGVSVSKKPSYIQTLWLCLWTKYTLQKKSKTLLKIPQIKDEKDLAITKILGVLPATAYFIDVRFFAYVIAYLVRFSIKRGESENAAFSYISFGTILSSSFQDFSLSKNISEQVIRQQETDPTDTDPRHYFVYANFIARWHRSLKECMHYCEKAYLLGLKSGDVIYTNYAIQVSLIIMTAQGVPLENILKKIQKDMSFVQKMNYTDMYYHMIVSYIFIKNLMSRTPHPTRFKDPSFDEAIDVVILHTQRRRTAISRYFTLKLQLLYLFEDYEEAKNIGLKSDKIICFSYGLLTTDEHYFYFGLTLIKTIKRMPWPQKIPLYIKLLSILKKFQKWANACPENYQHKYLLLLGEWHRHKGHHNKARTCFKNAVDMAQKEGFLQIIALGYDLQWQLDHHPDDLKQAYTYYLKWGARSKAEHLQIRYKNILSGI